MGVAIAGSVGHLRRIFNRGSDGKFDPETAAVADTRFEPDTSAHALDALADDCQPHTGARIGIVGVEAFEKPEDLLVMGGINADALVLDINARGGALLLGPDADH